MPGLVRDAHDIAGTKIINANPRNPDDGIPRASGLTLLFDPTTGKIICAMEAAHISAIRTASVSVLSMRLLHAKEMTTLCVLGAGVIGRAHVRLFAACFPSIRNIYLYDANRNRALALARAIQRRRGNGIRVDVTASPQMAVASSQAIVASTTTTKGYIHFDWLTPGTTLLNVSLDDALPDVLLRAHLLVVDDWNLIRNDSRRLLGRMYQSGLVVGPDHCQPAVGSRIRKVDIELGALVGCPGKGRKKDTDVVVVNPFGLSIEDIVIAWAVYRRALKTDLGVRLRR
jgi:ornithine cyclodeaminase